VSVTTGIITVYAGNGTPDQSSDGGPATNATFGRTSGVAADLAGNLYIADSFNNQVRKVDAATGIITTIAGGLNNPTGVVLDGAGNLYIADNSNARILKVNIGTGAVTGVAGGGDYCSFFDCNPGDFITVNGQTSSGIAENTITTSSLTISTGFLGD